MLLSPQSRLSHRQIVPRSRLPQYLPRLRILSGQDVNQHSRPRRLRRRPRHRHRRAPVPARRRHRPCHAAHLDRPRTTTTVDTSHASRRALLIAGHAAPLSWNEAAQTWEEPADDWGELHFSSAAPEVGAEWTDDGALREQRGLKARPAGEWAASAHPAATDQAATPAPGPVRHRPGRTPLLWGTRRRTPNNHLSAPVGQGARDNAQPRRVRITAAKRVYDLRHACVSTWLNGGVPPAQVAEWAGHSVAVLPRTYAKCIEGQDETAKRRIEAALRGD